MALLSYRHGDSIIDIRDSRRIMTNDNLLLDNKVTSPHPWLCLGYELAPPSTVQTAPVTKVLSGPRRKAITLAASNASPTRGMGVLITGLPPNLFAVDCIRGVSTAPLLLQVSWFVI